MGTKGPISLVETSPRLPRLISRGNSGDSGDQKMVCALTKATSRRRLQRWQPIRPQVTGMSRRRLRQSRRRLQRWQPIRPQVTGMSPRRLRQSRRRLRYLLETGKCLPPPPPQKKSNMFEFPRDSPETRLVNQRRLESPTSLQASEIGPYKVLLPGRFEPWTSRLRACWSYPLSYNVWQLLSTCTCMLVCRRTNQMCDRSMYPVYIWEPIFYSTITRILYMPYISRTDIFANLE